MLPIAMDCPGGGGTRTCNGRPGDTTVVPHRGSKAAVRQQVDNGVAGITKCLVQDQADTGHVGSPASDRSNGTCA
ncbi:hypothetical protein V6N13_005318 [Hibiscus sabdariffa]